jgi:hypothetical protein
MHPEGFTPLLRSTLRASSGREPDLQLHVRDHRPRLSFGALGGAKCAGSACTATYAVVVQGWGVVGSTPFKLHTWLIGDAAAGNMTVTAPATATTGATGRIDLAFSGLAAGTRYLGSVAYGGVTGLPNPTIVRVDTP